MSTTLFPLTHLAPSGVRASECDPVHSAVCEAADVNPSDAEVTVTGIDHDVAAEAILSAMQTIPGLQMPPFDRIEAGAYSDMFYVVIGADPTGYGRLVHCRAGEYQRV